MGNQKRENLGFFQHKCAEYHHNDICIVAYLLIANKYIRKHQKAFSKDPISWISTLKNSLRICKIDSEPLLRMIGFIYWHNFFSYKKISLSIRIGFLLLEPSLREDWLIDVLEEKETNQRTIMFRLANRIFDQLFFDIPHLISLLCKYTVALIIEKSNILATIIKYIGRLLKIK